MESGLVEMSSNGAHYRRANNNTNRCTAIIEEENVKAMRERRKPGVARVANRANEMHGSVSRPSTRTLQKS